MSQKIPREAGDEVVPPRVETTMRAPLRAPAGRFAQRTAESNVEYASEGERGDES